MKSSDMQAEETGAGLTGIFRIGYLPHHDAEILDLVLLGLGCCCITRGKGWFHPAAQNSGRAHKKVLLMLQGTSLMGKKGTSMIKFEKAKGFYFIWKIKCFLRSIRDFFSWNNSVYLNFALRWNQVHVKSRSASLSPGMEIISFTIVILNIQNFIHFWGPG